MAVVTEQIKVSVRGKRKAMALRALLQEIDGVELEPASGSANAVATDVPRIQGLEPAKEPGGEGILALVGIWKDRGIDADELRRRTSRRNLNK
jgi:hypothetical protein